MKLFQDHEWAYILSFNRGRMIARYNRKNDKVDRYGIHKDGDIVCGKMKGDAAVVKADVTTIAGDKIWREGRQFKGS